MNLFKWISFILLIFLKEGSPCLTPESYGSFEWHNYSGFCYSSGDNIPYTWERSNTACSKSNSLLASLHSMNDLAFLQNMLSQSTDVFWIGLRAKGLYSSYEWADGTAVDFVNWRPGDSDNGTINTDTCVYLDPSTGYFGRQNCNETHFYLCKGKDTLTPISIATSSPTTTYVLSALCPDGWHKFGDKCYGMFGLERQGKKSWPNANHDCLKKGATMVSIHSKEEQDFIYQKMSDKTDMTWIGMYEFESTDDRAFHWSDGSPMDFTYWNIGEPNNWKGNKEECVNIRFERPHLGKWNDAGCNTVLQSYICQIHAEIMCGDGICKNGGSCTHDEVTGVFKCFCAHGYNGLMCQNRVLCTDYTCQNGGTCLQDGINGTIQCACMHGYRGLTCEERNMQDDRGNSHASSFDPTMFLPISIVALFTLRPFLL